MVTTKVNKVLFLALFFILGQQVFGQTIDTQNSKVLFEVSNMKFRTVEGTFSNMTGTISFDERNLATASFDVCIDAATVNTQNQKRDDHLKNEDFFHVDKYPQICLTSSTVSKTKQGFVLKGELQMHGKTQTVEFPFTYTNNKFEGQLTIQRSDYGVGGSGSFMVGQEVQITIICIVQ